MKNRTIKAAGLLGFALLLAGSIWATNSSFYWSDASGARGTLYWDSICLSNSTFGGTIVSGSTLSGNGSGLTNLNGAYISAGNIATDRITNAMAAAGILTAGTITLTGTHTNNATTGKILIQNTLASATTLTGWWSKTAGGAASTVALGAFTAGTNTTLLTATNSSTVVFTGHTDGSAVLDVLIGGATGGPTTNYFNVVQRDGAIKSSSAMVFPGP